MLNMAETQLKNAGCAAPGHDAEAIYMHIFAVDKLGLFKIWGQPISEKDADLYFAEIEKRAARIPPLTYYRQRGIHGNCFQCK